MPETKFLYSIVLVAVIVAVGLLLAVNIYNNAPKIINEGINKATVKDALTCKLNTLNSVCSGKSTGSSGENCVGNFGDPNFQCTVCQTGEGVNTVYRCELEVCGCPKEWVATFGTMIFVLDKNSYSAGEKMHGTGNYVARQMSTQSGGQVQVQIINAATDIFGSVNGYGTQKISETSSGTIDPNGNFIWDYALPSDIKQGSYIAVAEFNKARYNVVFKVDQSAVPA